MKTLFEKYRPTTLDGIIGQPKAITVIKRLIQNGARGRCFWVSGSSGIGKTSIARIIASDIADDLYITEFCADQLSTAMLDKIEQEMFYRGFGKGGKVWICNESHGLRKQSIRRLLDLLEKIPDYCCFIFTTTRDGLESLFEDQQDANPLLSRCSRITLTNQGLSKIFAEHCRDIATSEGLNGKPLESYIRLAQNCKNNCRAMLNEIESGVML